MCDDTNDIESILDSYRPRGPDPALRDKLAQQPSRSSRWSFLEALAATLLVGMTLVQIGTSAARPTPEPTIDPARTQRMAVAIAQLDPAICPDEAYAMSLRLSSGERLVALPEIHGNPSLFMKEGVLR